MAKAIDRFSQLYGNYAGIQIVDRPAFSPTQTEFDNASRARGEAQARLEDAKDRRKPAPKLLTTMRSSRSRESAPGWRPCANDPTMQDANRLEGTAREARKRASVPCGAPPRHWTTQSGD